MAWRESSKNNKRKEPEAPEAPASSSSSSSSPPPPPPLPKPKFVKQIGYFDGCMQSNPCLHTIVMFYDDGTQEVRKYSNAKDIATMYLANRLEVPKHFLPYLTEEQKKQLPKKKKALSRGRKQSKTTPTTTSAATDDERRSILIAPRPQNYCAATRVVGSEDLARAIWESENTVYLN